MHRYSTPGLTEAAENRFCRRSRPIGAAIVTVCVALSGPRSLVTASGRTFPDTSDRIAVLTDQLPGNMTSAQQRFAATHYVGTQKLTLNLSRPLRAINPGFLVLHYHLAMWQSAPRVSFIVDGNSWGNDYDEVNKHESWFWHNPGNQRVASNQDGKLLMNVSDPGFRRYWSEAIAAEVQAGDYDGVFLDSASPALLQWEARSPEDPRLRATGVRDNAFPELGGGTWIAAWEDWIRGLDRSLVAKGIPLIPNVGAFATTWDNTDYSLTGGVFCEGFLDPGLSPIDWRTAMNQTLSLVQQNKIVILQNYVSPTDVAKRRYLLANYLLVKGSRTYISYFANPLDWYPEWTLDLGLARNSASRVNELLWKGVYRRDFANGVVLVNPDDRDVRVDLGGMFWRMTPAGGGRVAENGIATGSIATSNVTTLEIRGKAAEILLRQRPSQ